MALSKFLDPNLDFISEITGLSVEQIQALRQ
jgi:hypothetical protein